MIVRESVKTDLPSVMDIARGLPEWFSEDGLIQIEKDYYFQRQLVCCEAQGEIVGFVSFYCYEGILHIAWMGIKLCHRRKGLGEKLLCSLIDEAKKFNIDRINVKTLGEDVIYSPYISTRSFYIKNNFKLLAKKWNRENQSFEQEAIYSLDL